MKVVDILGYAGSSIKQQKGRSALTILGVVVGIAAIVALNSMTAGLDATITSQLEQGLSANTLTVTSGGGFFGGNQGGTPADLYIDDAAALETIDNVDAAIPVMTEVVFIEVSPGEFLQRTVTGVDFEKYAALFNDFSTDDGRGTIPVGNDSIVIGHGLYKPYDNDTVLYDAGDNLTLFWDPEPIYNGTVRIGTNYTKNYTASISGVLGEIGGFSFSGGPSDGGIYIHIDLARQLFDKDKVNSIIIAVSDSSDDVMDQVAADIKAYYENIGTVSVISGSGILDAIGNVFSTMSLFLTAIAAISLVVAGIGIMNIMIVSIMERTREIGILKAIGSKDRDILAVFLVEAFLIGLIGSLVGLATGYGGAYVLGLLLGRIMGGGGFARPGASLATGGASGVAILPIMGIDLVLQAIIFGILVSVVFGLYPAWKASRKPPVEALRYE